MIERIKKEIEERGLKKKWVANKIGCSPQMITMWLNEKQNMPQKWEDKLVEFLNLK